MPGGDKNLGSNGDSAYYAAFFAAISAGAIFLDLFVRYVIPRFKRSASKESEDVTTAVKSVTYSTSERRTITEEQVMTDTSDVVNTRTEYQLLHWKQPVVLDDRKLVDVTENQNISDGCLDILLQIERLQGLCSEVVLKVEQQALNLSKRDPDGKKLSKENTKDCTKKAMDCIIAVRGGWASLRSLLYCVDVHQRNAATYHEFFHEVDEYESCMTAEIKKLRTSFDESKATYNSKSAQRALKEMKDAYELIQFWESRVNDLLKRSNHIVPLPQRREKLWEPRIVTALCTYRTPAYTVKEGQVLKLLDNTDPEAWRLMTLEGTAITLPAIAVLIPPPDVSATESVDRLRIKLCVSLNHCIKALGKELIWLDTNIFEKWNSKSQEVTSVSTSQQTDVQANLQKLVDEMDINWSNYPEYTEMKSSLAKLKTMVTKASGGTDDSKGKQFVEDISESDEVLEAYKKFWNKWELFKVLTETSTHPDLMLVADKWEQMKLVKPVEFAKYWHADASTEEIITMMEETRMERLIGVQVNRELKTAESHEYTEASSELKETFSIAGVINPETGKEISIDQATRLGIIDQNAGVYKDDKNNNISIAEAMTQGLIRVESSKKKMTKEKVASVGILRITIKRENRPYTIRGVVDPYNSDKILPVEEALEKKFFDQDKSLYINPKTGTQIPVADAIDVGAVLVDFDQEAEKSEPEIVSKTYAIQSVKDQRSRKMVNFQEALSRGILNSDTGDYTNTITGEKMYIAEAMKRGLVKATIVDDEEMQTPDGQKSLKKMDFKKFI